MRSRELIRLSYRLFYLMGLASIIASLVIVAPVEGNVSPAFAQENWTQSQFCGGFNLTALVEHGAVDIDARFRPIGVGTWGGSQNWSLPPGGPATYTFNYNPQQPPGYEVLLRIRDDQNNVIYQAKVDLAPCPTTPPPTSTPPPTTPPPTTPPPTTPPVTTPPPTTPPVTTPPPTTPPPTTPPPTTPPPTTPPVTTPPPTTPPVTTPPPTTPPATTPPPTTPPATTPPPTTPPATTPPPTIPPPTTPPATTPPPTVPPPTTPPPTEPPNTPPPTNPPSTATPIQPPSTTGTPDVLIPVTGIDLSGQPEFSRRLLQNFGLGLLGLGLVLHGFTLRIKKDE